MTEGEKGGEWWRKATKQLYEYSGDWTYAVLCRKGLGYHRGRTSFHPRRHWDEGTSFHVFNHAFVYIRRARTQAVQRSTIVQFGGFLFVAFTRF